MKINKYIAIFLCLILTGLVFSACETDRITNKGKRTNAFFKTETEVVVYGDFTQEDNLSQFEEAWEKSKEIFDNVEKSCSLSVENSDVKRFNEISFGETIEISELTARIVEIAKRAYEDTKGLFDPTVYALVDLWGFTPRFNEFDYERKTAYDRDYIQGVLPLPEEKYIQAFRNLVGFDKVILTKENEKYFLTKNIEEVVVDNVSYRAMLDLGGIGKGYAVELVDELLSDYGFSYGYASSGSSSMALKKKHNKKSDNVNFELGVRKPRAGTDKQSVAFSKVAVSDVHLSSSGDYENFYFIGGERYSHIINSKTGYPMNVGSLEREKIASVTILGEGAGYTDAISTAVCLMSVSDGIRYLENLTIKGYAYILTTTKKDSDFFTVYSSYNEKQLVLTDNAYKRG